MTSYDWDRRGECPACGIPDGLMFNLPHPDAPPVTCAHCGEAFYVVSAVELRDRL